MRTAPAVDAALGDGRRERILVALAYGVGGAALCSWILSHAAIDAGAWPWLAAGVSSLVGVVAWPTPPRRLRWTGQSWLQADGEPLRAVSVQIDIGHWMLLRLSPQSGRSSWVGVSAEQAGAAWHGLRVALRFHACGSSGSTAKRTA